MKANIIIFIIIILGFYFYPSEPKIYYEREKINTDSILKMKNVINSQKNINIKLIVENNSKIKFIGYSIEKTDTSKTLFLNLIDNIGNIKNVFIQKFDDIDYVSIRDIEIIDNEIIIGGYHSSEKFSSHWIAKVSLEGKFLFSKSFRYHLIEDITVTSKGNILVLSSNNGTIVKKFNKYGKKLWEKEFHHTNNYAAGKIKVTSNGTIFVLSEIKESTFHSFASLMVLTENGYLKKEIVFDKKEIPYHLEDFDLKVKDNNAYLLAKFSPWLSDNNHKIYKFNTNGEIIWDYYVPDKNSRDTLQALSITEKNNILIFGTRVYNIKDKEDKFDKSFRVLKLDGSSGELLKEKTFFNMALNKNRTEIKQSYFNSKNKEAIFLFRYHDKVMALKLDSIIMD